MNPNYFIEWDTKGNWSIYDSNTNKEVPRGYPVLADDIFDYIAGPFDSFAIAKGNLIAKLHELKTSFEVAIHQITQTKEP